jgi:hypothetical protein
MAGLDHHPRRLLTNANFARKRARQFAVAFKPSFRCADFRPRLASASSWG